MSTSGVFVFKDHPNDPGYAVYKHHDCYPTGAAPAILGAFQYAWKLPRFEADELAASFVAFNKQPPTYNMQGGGVRLMLPDTEYSYGADYMYIICGNLKAYNSPIGLPDSHVTVEAYSMDLGDPLNNRKIFECALDDLVRYADVAEREINGESYHDPV